MTNLAISRTKEQEEQAINDIIQLIQELNSFFPKGLTTEYVKKYCLEHIEATEEKILSMANLLKRNNYFETKNYVPLTTRTKAEVDEVFISLSEAISTSRKAYGHFLSDTKRFQLMFKIMGIELADNIHCHLALKQL